MRISKELCYSKKNLSIFEGLKKIVLKINNNYWRRISDDNHKKRTVCILQNYTPRTLNFEQGLLSSPIDITSILLTTSTKCHCSLLFPNRPFHNLPLLSILGSNEKLTLLEHCHKLHSVISSPILRRFPRSQSQLKALKKTFQLMPVTS